MPKTIPYVRRVLPLESKRVPVCLHGQGTPNVPVAVKNTPPFQGSGALPEAPAVPPSRVSAPR